MEEISQHNKAIEIDIIENIDMKDMKGKI